MAGVPFKVCVPSSNLQVGVVARSYDHFRDLLQTKLGLAKDSQVYLDDGTLVVDQDYFDLLEPQTKLTVIEKAKVGEKRSMVANDSVASLPPAKRSSPLHTRVINSRRNSAFQDNLVDCLRISSVAGSVPMQVSPTHSPNPAQTPLVRRLSRSCIQQSPCVQPNANARNTQPLSHFPLGQLSHPTQHSLYQQVQPTNYDQVILQRHRIPTTNLGISPRYQQSHQHIIPAGYGIQYQYLSYPHQYYQEPSRVSVNPKDTTHIHVPENLNRQAKYHQQLARRTELQAMPSRARQPPPLFLIANTDGGATQNGGALTNALPSTQQSPLTTNQVTSSVIQQQPNNSIHEMTPELNRKLSVTDCRDEPHKQKSNTPIQRMSPMSEVKRRLSVVDCRDEPQTEETDDEDKLCIIESAEGSPITSGHCSPKFPFNLSKSTPTTPVRSGNCSPTFSFSLSKLTSTTPVRSDQCNPFSFNLTKLQSRPSTLSTHSICQENTFTAGGCESPISIDEEDATTTSKQCDLSPDDGYSSSSPPQSATELHTKLPFADFEGPPQSSPICEKSDVEVPSTEQELVDVETVDDTIDGGYSCVECLHSQEEHVESPAPLQLVVSVPVHCKEKGTILCQGVKRLGVSIPVRVSPSGQIICRGFEMGRVETKEVIIVSDGEEDNKGCDTPRSGKGCVGSVRSPRNEKEPTFCTYQSEIQWLETCKKHLPDSPIELPCPEVESQDKVSVTDQLPSSPMEDHSEPRIQPTPVLPVDQSSILHLEQPPTPLTESQVELVSTLTQESPQTPVEHQADLPSPPMFQLLLESSENLEESRPQQMTDTTPPTTCPVQHQELPEPEEQPVVVEDYGRLEHVMTTPPLPKTCTAEEIQQCVQTLVAFAEKLQKEEVPELLLVDDVMVFADVQDDVGNEITVDSLEDNVDPVNEIRLENAVPDDEIETEVVVDMDANVYACDQQISSEHDIPFICAPLGSPSARNSISEGINKLIEVADDLSEEDCTAIRDFFHDGPTTAEGLRKYVLQTGTKYVCLELNFDTREWCGYILAH